MGRNLRTAGRSGLAAWIGFLEGTAFKVALVVAMPVIAAVAYLF